jgi:glyoxylase-like metal-dependent hydrolase (beta-lactamase superfamily II)
MDGNKKYPVQIEWVEQKNQIYHGPRKRMRELLNKYRKNKFFSQSQVVEYLLENYPQCVSSMMKLKFYLYNDRDGKPLRFFILWCDYNAEIREVLFEESERIVSKTGWYPMITGSRVFHHRRPIVDFMEFNMKKTMNKNNIEKLPGLGNLEKIINFSNGNGTSVLIQTSAYDLILDAGMTDKELKLDCLRRDKRKWLFLSHCHKDHTGGINPFINNKLFVISTTPLTLELLFTTIFFGQGIVAEGYLPKNFFYRFAPMWYRANYQFSDGSSITTLPTYHYPGSIGFLFTFSNGKKLFYSGDINLSASYLSINKLNNLSNTFSIDETYVDYALFDGAYIGRKIGSDAEEAKNILKVVEDSILAGKNFLFLTPPADYGVFLYFHLYNHFISSSRKLETRIFLDPIIMNQIKLIEWRLKRQRKGELDDALIKYFEQRQTLIESVRVFDSSINLEKNIKYLNEKNIPVIIILDDSKYNDKDYISDQSIFYLKNFGLNIARIGKSATRPIDINNLDTESILNFDEGIWLLHTQEQLLKDYFLSNKGSFGHILLFHNFQKRIEKFIKELNLDGYEGKVSFLSDLSILGD